MQDDTQSDNQSRSDTFDDEGRAEGFSPINGADTNCEGQPSADRSGDPISANALLDEINDSLFALVGTFARATLPLEEAWEDSFRVETSLEEWGVANAEDFYNLLTRAWESEDGHFHDLITCFNKRGHLTDVIRSAFDIDSFCDELREAVGARTAPTLVDSDTRVAAPPRYAADVPSRAPTPVDSDTHVAAPPRHAADVPSKAPTLVDSDTNEQAPPATTDCTTGHARVERLRAVLDSGDDVDDDVLSNTLGHLVSTLAGATQGRKGDWREPQNIVPQLRAWGARDSELFYQLLHLPSAYEEHDVMTTLVSGGSLFGALYMSRKLEDFYYELRLAVGGCNESPASSGSTAEEEAAEEDEKVERVLSLHDAAEEDENSISSCSTEEDEAAEEDENSFSSCSTSEEDEDTYSSEYITDDRSDCWPESGEHEHAVAQGTNTNGALPWPPLPRPFPGMTVRGIRVEAQGVDSVHQLRAALAFFREGDERSAREVTDALHELLILALEADSAYDYVEHPWHSKDGAPGCGIDSFRTWGVGNPVDLCRLLDNGVGDNLVHEGIFFEEHDNPATLLTKLREAIGRDPTVGASDGERFCSSGPTAEGKPAEETEHVLGVTHDERPPSSSPEASQLAEEDRRTCPSGTAAGEASERLESVHGTALGTKHCAALVGDLRRFLAESTALAGDKELAAEMVLRGSKLDGALVDLLSPLASELVSIGLDNSGKWTEKFDRWGVPRPKTLRKALTPRVVTALHGRGQLFGGRHGIGMVRKRRAVLRWLLLAFNLKPTASGAREAQRKRSRRHAPKQAQRNKAPPTDLQTPPEKQQGGVTTANGGAGGAQHHDLHGDGARDFHERHGIREERARQILEAVKLLVQSAGLTRAELPIAAAALQELRVAEAPPTPPANTGASAPRESVAVLETLGHGRVDHAPKKLPEQKTLARLEALERFEAKTKVVHQPGEHGQGIAGHSELKSEEMLAADPPRFPTPEGWDALSPLARLSHHSGRLPAQLHDALRDLFKELARRKLSPHDYANDLTAGQRRNGQHAFPNFLRRHGFHLDENTMKEAFPLWVTTGTSTWGDTALPPNSGRGGNDTAKAASTHAGLSPSSPTTETVALLRAKLERSRCANKTLEKEVSRQRKLANAREVERERRESGGRQHVREPHLRPSAPAWSPRRIGGNDEMGCGSSDAPSASEPPPKSETLGGRGPHRAADDETARQSQLGEHSQPVFNQHAGRATGTPWPPPPQEPPGSQWQQQQAPPQQTAWQQQQQAPPQQMAWQQQAPPQLMVWQQQQQAPPQQMAWQQQAPPQLMAWQQHAPPQLTAWQQQHAPPQHSAWQQHAPPQLMAWPQQQQAPPQQMALHHPHSPWGQAWWHSLAGADLVATRRTLTTCVRGPPHHPSQQV